MFTLDQIKSAHSLVKSGADFPAYIQDILKLGVTCYETYIADGHTDYYGANQYTITNPPKYEVLTIAGTTDAATFKAGLKAHQKGQTDFMSFIALCAATGIHKWTVCLDKMTCTYYSQEGDEVLVEQIPQP